MSIQMVAQKFTELCRQGKNAELMRTMYSPTIVSIESDGKQTAGLQSVIKKFDSRIAQHIFHGESVAGPFFNGANSDQFAVFFTFDLTRRSTDKRSAFEEVAVFTVDTDDKITREQFFNDEAQ